MIKCLIEASLQPHLKAAKEARDKAMYPGCEEGRDHCLSLTCMCNEFRPSRKFLIARAIRIRDGEEV